MPSGTISVQTKGSRDLLDVTDQLQSAVEENGVEEGVLYAYNPHTTAGLTINEGADPAVAADLLKVFREIVPNDFPYRHLEGNSPSHMMTLLTGSSVHVIIEEGRLQLGTWQRIFFCEYDGPRNRKLRWKILVG
jgi:secondary thiamine-phosphate synthase enzyme